ncbi:MAG: hypothetical protein K8R99_06735 [Actinomycetia bacterium]|nr:hypothetical protein [Actinomycetes bacterium]
MLQTTSSTKGYGNRWRTRWLLALAMALPIVGTTTPASVVDAAGASVVVYDAIGSSVPGNVPSQAFQATQTVEFGDMVSLAAGPRALESVTVEMSSWGCESRPGGICTTTPGATFSHPLTLNVYAVTGTDAAPVLGALLATKTQTFAIPFRPTTDPTCAGGTAWRETGSGTCFNGLATPVTFDFSGSTVLPNRIVWAVAFNTTSYGASPMGTGATCFSTAQGCGYDSLNVGAQSLPGAPFVGTDVVEEAAFLNTGYAPFYCDGGPTVGTLRNDTNGSNCWTGYRPLAKITTKTDTAASVVVKAANLHDWIVDTTVLGNPAVPFAFNGPDDTGSGTSSFRFGPIAAPNGSKLEMQPPLINSLVSEFGGMQYEFQVITPVAGTSANHFYTNVYVDSAANGIGLFGPSAAATGDGFYDCRYSFVPSSSVAGWNTFSFDNWTVAVNPTNRIPGFAGGCGATTIGGATLGSKIEFFRINGGDTSPSDNGLEGAYDRVVLRSGGVATTYDFEDLTIIHTDVDSARILDTRNPGGHTVDGLHQAVGKLAAGQTYVLPVAGRAGLSPTTDTVVLNVTAVLPRDAGFITVFECGEARPNASNLNFLAGEVVANSVSTQLAGDGSICIFSSAQTDVLVDVTGVLRALEPLVEAARVLDTRSPFGQTADGLHQAVGRVAAGQTYELPVAGRVGVAPGAATVLLNVAALLPSANGFITVFPCGQPLPTASNLNFVVGDLIANSMMARVGTGGKVCIYSSAATDLIVDVNGFFTDFVSLVQLAAPSRMLDTRSPGAPTIDHLHQGVGRVAAGSTYVLPIAGRIGIPANAESVVLNVTAVLPSDAGFITVFACGQPVPNASNLNFFPGDVVPNLVLVGVGTGGSVCLFSSAETDILVDISGYFAAQ